MLIIWRDNLNYQLLDVENVSLQKSSSASIQFPGRRLFPLSSEWSSRNLKEELDLKEESESDSDRMHPNPKFVSLLIRVEKYFRCIREERSIQKRGKKCRRVPYMNTSSQVCLKF